MGRVRDQAELQLHHAVKAERSKWEDRDGKRERELALTKSQYEIVDGVLYHVENDKTLRIVPASGDRRKIFDEAHAGAFGGHLQEAKMHSQLAKHYWWPRMHADITHCCCGVPHLFRFNRTLTSMLAKTMEKQGQDWDDHLPLRPVCV